MQPKQPALILCLAAPEDAVWLAQWERHLLPLQRAGHLRLWSERLVLAGEDRLQQMSWQVNQADLVVFLLSSDFFASEECMLLMERALMRQHNEKMTLVPLLLRPSTWEDSLLRSFSCLPSQAQAVTSWDNTDEAFQTCVEGIRQLLGLPMRDRVQKRQISLPLRQRLQVIHGLTQEYRQRLDHSLQGQAAIELGLHERTDVIASSARLVFHDTEAEHPLPVGTTIIQVYDRAQFGLLVLGAPGAGKTTLLLELAQKLLQRAENDAEHPLPIVLSLASWSTKKRELVDWLPEQLSLVYGIAKKIGASWIEHDQVLFLLDGLDEMDISARSACVAAMNRYRAEHFVSLVISSRSREYEQQQARLILPAAIEVQPLELAEVGAYLAQAGPALATVRTAIQANTILQQLMTTPLMLMIILRAYRDQDAEELPQVGSPTDYQQLIFRHYIQLMLARHQHRITVSMPPLLRSLRWLAQSMQRRHLTEFYLEQLQPTWLQTKRDQTLYRILNGFFVGLALLLGLGTMFWAVGWSMWNWPQAGWLGVLIGLCSGPLLSWKDDIMLHTIYPQGTLKWSWKNARPWLSGGLLFGLLAGSVIETPGIQHVWLPGALQILLSTGYGAVLHIVLFFGLPSGLIGMLFFGLIGGLSSERINEDRRSTPNQGIHSSGWNALRLTLIFGLLGGLSGGVFGQLLFGLAFGLFTALEFGFVFGGRDFLRHYFLRYVLWQSDALPWYAVPLLEEATDCILLQRVGGGYRFIHPLLQEYFASLDVEAILGQSEG